MAKIRYQLYSLLKVHIGYNMIECTSLICPISDESSAYIGWVYYTTDYKRSMVRAFEFRNTVTIIDDSKAGLSLVANALMEFFVTINLIFFFLLFLFLFFLFFSLIFASVMSNGAFYFCYFLSLPTHYARTEELKNTKHVFYIKCDVFF